EVAVISAGTGGANRSAYHHPRRDVLDRLHTLNRTQNLKRIFMTTRGETDGGLTDEDLALMNIANGHVVIFATQNSYAVNGEVFPTDGQKSRAFDAPPATQQECTP
ncbi:MAG TPA: hypothetical protein VD713_03740, partial [Sphingomonadales bacterium]|nr:hypothetical protein [Sphingomonadales bacterium]